MLSTNNNTQRSAEALFSSTSPVNKKLIINSLSSIKKEVLSRLLNTPQFTSYYDIIDLEEIKTNIYTKSVSVIESTEKSIIFCDIFLLMKFLKTSGATSPKL